MSYTHDRLPDGANIDNPALKSVAGEVRTMLAKPVDAACDGAGRPRRPEGDRVTRCAPCQPGRSDGKPDGSDLPAARRPGLLPGLLTGTP